MSAAIHSVQTIRNAALESGLSLREQTPTERDEMRRSESVSESIESLIAPLTARQMHAINLLAMGKTVVATARSLDIGVSTLHRWKATHPLFKAELAQRQHNLFDAMIQKLRLTMSKAVDNLFEMMSSTMKSERKEVTHAMLKLLRPQKFLVPSEPMSAEAVLDEAVREKRASRGESMSEEITEEERIAAIPEEFRVSDNARGTGEGRPRAEKRHVERSETSGVNERHSATSTSGHARSSQILREYAQDDGVGEERGAAARRHAERSEASGPIEREKTSTCKAPSARREPTPLPSREGPGEGAASDEIQVTGERAGDVTTVNPRIAKCSKSADASNATLANASHAQLNPATVIAARPLPQPLQQGEGSQRACRADQSVIATSLSDATHPGLILREYAQDDVDCGKQIGDLHVPGSHASDDPLPST